MTSGGNIKQRVAFWAALSFWLLTLMFGLTAIVEHKPDYLGLMGLCLASALIFSAGVWTMGLERRPAGSDEEAWQDAIK
jgi:hypothetical protein